MGEFTQNDKFPLCLKRGYPAPTGWHLQIAGIPLVGIILTQLARSQVTADQNQDCIENQRGAQLQPPYTVH